MEIGDGEVLVQPDGPLVTLNLHDGSALRSHPTPCVHTHRFVVLAHRRINHTTIEENLGGIGDGVKHAEGFIELLVVVVLEGKHPGLDFLEGGGQYRLWKRRSLEWRNYLFQRHDEPTRRDGKIAMRPTPGRETSRRARLAMYPGISTNGPGEPGRSMRWVERAKHPCDESRDK